MNAPAATRTRLVSAADVRSASDGSRAVARALVSGVLISVVAVLLIPLGVVTLFRARQLYSYIAALACRFVLRFYGIRIQILPPTPKPFPATQTVFVSNHTSTLDLFVLVALRLPNCRFFLSGFLRRFVPLGVISSMMGTFFTVPQDRPAERTRIFQRAERTLRRTRESVYLSPEGGRITSGEIGYFNKGAFHLATNLRVPIVPFYIEIPRESDPRLGYDARPGVVTVHLMPAIDTSDWTLDRLEEHRTQVRDVFVRFHDSRKRS